MQSMPFDRPERRRLNGPAALTLGLVLLAGAGGLAFGRAEPAPAPDPAHLRYTPDGRAIVPSNYRDWPFLSAGLDMNYSDPSAGMDHHTFDNVFVDPDSLAAFRATGRWPDGTVLVKEDRGGVTKGSINKSGQFQGEDVMGLELHVKDSRRFEGGWGFFLFSKDSPAQKIPTTAQCYACHQAHGAVDSTFVQFYPTLIGVARDRQTLSASYLAETKGEPSAAPRIQ
jgi:hypothetical protein